MGFFKRVTSSWTKPNKRNNYWPMSLAIEDKVTGLRTAIAMKKQSRAHRKKYGKRKGRR